MSLLNFNRINYKEILKVLKNFILQQYPECTISESMNSIKIILKELDNFTVIYISFEKSKVILRHNIKSFDNLVQVKPNLDFIYRIITEIQKLGFEISIKDNDGLQSTCRIELEGRN